MRENGIRVCESLAKDTASGNPGTANISEKPHSGSGKPLGCGSIPGLDAPAGSGLVKADLVA